jgi:hypothetical protein
VAPSTRGRASRRAAGRGWQHHASCFRRVRRRAQRHGELGGQGKRLTKFARSLFSTLNCCRWTPGVHWWSLSALWVDVETAMAHRRLFLQCLDQRYWAATSPLQGQLWRFLGYFYDTESIQSMVVVKFASSTSIRICCRFLFVHVCRRFLFVHVSGFLPRTCSTACVCAYVHMMCY